jgi:hypothetical protein
MSEFLSLKSWRPSEFVAFAKAREQSLGLTFGSDSGVGMVPDAGSAMDQNLVG